MKIKNFIKNKGITLLETIVYLGLFTILFTTIVTFVISVAQANQIAGRRKNIEKTFIFVNEHMSETFTKVNSVDSVNSVFLSDTSILRMPGRTNYYEYKIVNGKLNFTDTSGVSTDITTAEFNVDRFYIEEVLNGGTVVVGVRLTFEISSRNDPEVTDTIQTFYTFR